MKRTILALGLLACWLPSAPAQETPSTNCEVPVVVSDYNNRLVRYLKPSDFSVRAAGDPMSVTGVSLDAGPKRIAVVLDSSSTVPKEEWKLETEMAQELVSHARAGDQFLLTLLGGGASSETFASSGELTTRLRQLQIAGPNGDAKERIYDVLAESARNFAPPRFGDTIFFFGHHLDSQSSVSLEMLRDLILSKGLRFLGISFEDRFAGHAFQPNKPLPKNSLAPLETLSSDTGYFFSYHTVRDLAYPGQEPLFKNFLTDLYTWISEPYRVELSAPSGKEKPDLLISVSDMEARKVNQRGIHFPHVLYGCVQTTKSAELPRAATAQ